MPVLYLLGISTGDFQEALAALAGKDAPNCAFRGIASTDFTVVSKHSPGS